jgi:hypothetical protein
MYRQIPGRPDCDKEEPEFDGTCPRRGYNMDLVVGKFMLLGGMFLRFGVLPIHGGLYDQDLRFSVTLGVLAPEFQESQVKTVQAQMAAMLGGRTR